MRTGCADDEGTALRSTLRETRDDEDDLLENAGDDDENVERLETRSEHDGGY